MASTRTASSSSSLAGVGGKIDGRAREFFWGITLSKDNPEHTWTLKEEDDDGDFLEHTLFLRHAVLGTGGTDGERNLITIETQDYQGAEIKHPLFCLTGGKLDMCQLDINFGSEQPVTFKLVEGTGPVHLSAQQLVEFPPEDLDETETEYTATEDEEELTEEGGDSHDEGEPAKGKKRKASEDKAAKKKKGKSDKSGTEEEEDEVEEEEEESEEESMEEDEEDSEVSSPEKKSKKKGAVKSKVVKPAAKKSSNKAPAAKKGKKK